jgi:hypothetical protein
MMPGKFDRLMEDCFSRMDRGESLPEILAVYPDQAEKIKPLLLVAMLSRALLQPVPGYTALRLGKNQLLAEMASMQAEDSFLHPKPQKPPRSKTIDRWIQSLGRLQPAYRLAMVSLVVILGGGFFTISASASGLANQVLQTLFYGFQQVGDLLLVRPAPGYLPGESPIFSHTYGLPDSPLDYSGDFKALNFDSDQKGQGALGPGGVLDPSALETRIHVFGAAAVEQPAVFAAAAADQKDLDKEAREEEKDLDKEAKEEEKDLLKEEKEDEKDLLKTVKEDEKAADKAVKDLLKEEKEADKDKDK